MTMTLRIFSGWKDPHTYGWIFHLLGLTFIYLGPNPRVFEIHLWLLNFDFRLMVVGKGKEK